MSSLYFDDIIMFIIFSCIAYVIPAVLTIWNIYNCCSTKPKKEKLISTLTVFVGGVFNMILHCLQFEEAGDWYEQINTMQIHNSISSEYEWFVILILVFGFTGLLLLLLVDAEKIPPLISIMAIVALLLLNVFQIIYAIQLAQNASGIDYLLYVYHANILLLSAYAIQKQMRQQVVNIANKAANGKEHKILQWLYLRMTSLSKYTIIVFVSLFFVIAVLEILFVLVGQGLDAPVKAFTDTADWTFSKQIPPPPIDYEGHYLCTIAAGGHKKIVKPLRLGLRKGKVIVVNRQLCIANAFEEVIQEKFPVFHKKIRHFYDTYGYPVSRYITSPIRADVVYILMKPLEWIFLIFLYLVDVHPEQRIHAQYGGSLNNEGCDFIQPKSINS